MSDKMREALEWYASTVADCRKITREGEDARARLDRDGGSMAREALDALNPDAEVERIMGLTDADLLAEADADDVAWARSAKIGLQFGKALAAIPTTDAGDWVMVPREPTEAMLADGIGAFGKFRCNPSDIRRVWTWMIAASPTPSTDVGVDEVRPDDEILDPHLPESIRGAKRCGIQRSAWLDGWFIPWSPRNDNANAEGAWSDWVDLAKAILAADAKAIAAIRKGER